MKTEDIVAHVENAVREIQHEKIEYFDFLGLLSDRIAVLFVMLHQLYDVDLSDLSVSRDSYAAALIVMVCDELEDIHSNICALLDSHDDESGGDACDGE